MNIDPKDGADLRDAANGTHGDVRVIVAIIFGVTIITAARLIAEAIKAPGR